MFNIHLDCLQLSLKKKQPFEAVQTNNFTIGELNRIANYERAYAVYDATTGAQVARFYDINPLNPEYSQLKIENPVFYRDISINAIVANFCSDYNLTFSHVIQIDICADCDRFKFCGRYPAETFILRVLNRQTERQRRFNRALIRAKFTDDKIDVKGKRHAETLYLSKTNVALKIYNKTKELHHSGKTYISDGWPDDLAGDVWRVEISLKNEILKNVVFDGQTLFLFSDFDNLQKISSIFWKLMNEYYTMKDNRHNAGHYCPLIEQNNFVMSYNLQFGRRALSASDYYEDNSYNKGIEKKLARLAAGDIAAGKMLNDHERETLVKAALLLEQLRTGDSEKNAAFLSVSPISNTD